MAISKVINVLNICLNRVVNGTKNSSRAALKGIIRRKAGNGTPLIRNRLPSNHYCVHIRNNRDTKSK